MTRERAQEKAHALVEKMTLKEAASQLSYQAPAIERLGIPSYNWWNEALHGVARAGMATMFPQAIGMAATFDTELVEKLGDIASTEGRAKYNAASRHGDRDIYKGLTFWSPNINIFRDPRWGRGQETFGEDPVLTAEMGKAYVRGLQGTGETLKASACAKHFAVHSGPEDLRHEFNAVASDKDMAETYLPAFEELVKDAHVESVMGAYNRTNDEPCCGSPKLMKKLREDWGFKGHFVSDCWAIRDFHEGHFVTKNAVESAALALNTGCDLNCGCTYENLMLAYDFGMVSEDTIRKSAERLFTTRYLLGIMGEGSEYDAIPYQTVECDEHLAKAREAAEKACVLVKNNGILPFIPEKLHTLAVIGPNANSRKALEGNYHGTASRYVTVSEGIQDALSGKVKVLCAEGCDLFRDRVSNLAKEPDDRLSEAVTIAEESDAVVLVVGLDETIEGEQGDTSNQDGSSDKLDLLLPAGQRRLMDAVLAVNKPTVICLLAGSAIDLAEAGEKADAILVGWYPGAQGGRTIADILFGKVSPSGKLPVTFYHNTQLSEMPEFTDYSMRGRTYRYVESDPVYPFGYGLTYGEVYVEDVQKTGESTLTVTAVNHGTKDTEDVIQVYVQNEGSANAPKHPRLAAFKRIFVRAGKSVTVSLEIEPKRLLVVNRAGQHIHEGTCVAYVGVGQPDARTKALTGHSSVRIALE